MRKPALLLVCVALLLTLAVVSVRPGGAAEGSFTLLSAEERAWLDQNPDKLTLLYNTDFPPIEYASPTGAFEGLGADVIAKIEARLGVTFRKRPSTDWNQHLAALESGECAIAPTIVRTAERERYAFFTTPYATVPVVIITTRAHRGKLNLDDLAGRRVAVVSGYATETYVRHHAQGRFTVMPVRIVTDGLRDVSFGQADALVENLAVAAYYIEREGLPNLRVAGSTDYAFAWSIGVSRKYPLLYSAIQKALTAIPADELDATHKRWIALEASSRLDPDTVRLLELAAFFTGLLLVGLTGITYVLKRRLNEKIAGLRQTHEELRASEQRFRAIFDHAPYAITINNLEDGRFLDVNQSFLNRSGLSKEEALRLRFVDMAPEVRTDYILDALRKAGAVSDLEARVYHRHGWSDVIYSSVLLEIQERQQVLSVTVDVTEKKRAEESLRESEQSFRNIVESSPIGMHLYEVQPDGRLVFTAFNPAANHILGVDNTVFVGKSIEEAFPALTATEIPIRYREAAARGIPWSTEYIEYRENGIAGAFSVYAFQIAPNRMVAQFMDVTERKRSEHALRKSEARFQSLFAMAPVALANVAADGRIIAVNHSWTQLLGYTRDDIPTLDHWWPLAYPDPEYRKQAMAYWQAAIEQAMAHGSNVEGNEYRVMCKDGVVRTLIIGATLLEQDFIASFFDITDRKRSEEELQHHREHLEERVAERTAELRQAMNQLVQSEKLAALGSLVAGVAHELNTPLGNTRMVASSLGEHLRAFAAAVESGALRRSQVDAFLERSREAVDLLERNSARAAELMGHFKQVAVDQTSMRRRRFYLRQTIEEMLATLRPLFKRTAHHIELEIPPDLELDSYPGPLEQVLANLVGNSLTHGFAGQDRGVIRIGAKALDADHVELNYTDNGIGIPENIQNRIFDPFFTTKMGSGGSGLGLYIVYNLITGVLGGTIEVHTLPATGTVFTLTLPRVAPDRPALGFPP